jgi:FtsZ-interacting cell division protein ZipA
MSSEGLLLVSEILLIVAPLCTLLGVVAGLWFNRRKTSSESEKYQAEAEKHKAEAEKMRQEAERLELENKNLVQVQMNALTKENNELKRNFELSVNTAVESAMVEIRKKYRQELDRIHKGQEEFEAKLYISSEKELTLSKEMTLLRIEKQRLESMLDAQHKDIVEIKKQTGQLPEQLPGTLEHKP